MPTRAFQSTLATATTLGWVPLNVNDAFSDVTIFVNKVGGGDRTAVVEWTLDNILVSGVSAVPVTAFEFAANSAHSFDHAIAGIRLRVVTGSGSAAVGMRVLQAHE